MQKIPFLIESIDPLGQGVSRLNGKVVFIAKTLPGESGSAISCKKAKGVEFARLQKLEVTSPLRQAPSCAHYASCPGCQFLHAGYDTELASKQDTLARYLGKLGVEKDVIELIPAEQRLGYRNRIQLHYRSGKIGLVDGLIDTIVEIPDCQVVQEELRASLAALYAGEEWKKGHGKQGHCELYLRGGEVSVAWNDAYAHGGFSQVNSPMNEKLCALVKEAIVAEKPVALLDLFAGDGNLTNFLAAESAVSRLMVDQTGEATATFLPLNLLEDEALPRFKRRSPQKKFDLIVLDPPRGGFPALAAWAAEFGPKTIIYVSCNPAALARDLAALEGSYHIRTVALVDLFPSTCHFETVVVLGKGRKKEKRK